MTEVNARGLSFHVRDSGTAGPVVLVFPDAGATADAWARLADAIADAGYRVRVVDHRGHGGSTRFGDAVNPWDAVTMDAFVSDARALLPALAPDGAHVVGHGVGGAVAAWLAYWEGVERVRSLVVAACPPQSSAAFRAAHGKRPDATGDDAYAMRRANAVRDMLADLEDDEIPGEFMTQYKGRTLVAEGADDPAYNPAQTMLWYGWLRNGRVLRAPGGHDFPVDGGIGETWFRDHVIRHLEEADA